MKVTVNIDCTPEEARTFFGLPDVKPMQDAMMEEMQRRMKEGLTAQDMETIMKAWTNPALTQSVNQAMSKGMEQMQKSFWGAFGGQGTGAGPKANQDADKDAKAGKSK
jgi:ketosteroid isomerase-like protein